MFLLSLLLLSFLSVTYGQTITTTSFSSNPVCQGRTTNVIFTVSGGSFNAGNIFTAQLSDASGNFGSPLNLTPTLTGTGSGTITSVIIPLATPPGSGYRIRVVSDNPAYTGDPGLSITINTTPAPTISGPSSVCVNSTGNVYTTEAGMGSYTWNISGGTMTGSGNTRTVTWTTAGAGSISVNYTNASGCRALSSTAYPVTVIANPSPPAAGNSSRCGPGTVTITAIPGAGETVDWYANPTGGVPLLSGNTSFTTPSISSTTTYYAEARNIAAGCLSATRTAVTATVNPQPSAPAAGNNSRCGTGTITITATPSAGETVDWYDSPSGGTLLLPGNTIYTTPSISATTIYYAEARNTTTGCVSATRTTVTATVSAAPNLPTAGNNSRCGTGTVTITATPGAGETIDWYAASTGGTALLTGNISYTTPSISVTTIYYAEARNTTSGCLSSTRSPVTSTINPVPVPSLTGPLTACAGSAGNVYTTDAGMTNYVWTVSAGGTITTGGTSTDNSVTVTWNTVGARTVSVNYTDAQGCTGASPSVLNITVNAAPAPTITGPATACQGGTTNYTYTTQTGMTNYVWSVTGGTITAGGGTSNNTATIVWNTLGAQSVSVNYTNGGCAAGSPFVYNVTVNPRPVPTITGQTTVCQGIPGYVYTTESGMSSYTWSISSGGNITAGSGTNSVTVTWTTSLPQTLSVNYTNPSGCRAVASTPISVTVNPTQQPIITGPSSVCAGTTNNTYSTQAGMSNYIWSISSGGTITSGGTTADNTVTVTWNTPGVQIVTVNFTNSYGCTPAGASLHNVTVNPLPSPAITGPASSCIGSAGNIYTTEPGMTNYSWTVSPGGTVTAGGGSANNTVTVTWNTAGPQTVTVNYTNAYGCYIATPTIYNITVNTLPVATLNGPAPVCTGSANNVYTTEPGMANYIWTVSPGGTVTSGGGSTNNTVTVTWNSAGFQSVQVTYTDTFGCTTAPVTVPVTVTPVPTASISYSGMPWCTTAGIQTVTLTGTGGYTGGTFSASPAGLSINTSTGAITPASSSQGNYTVSYSTPAAGGCSPVIVTTEVAITATPSATIFYAPNSYCSNAGIVTVTRTGTAGGTYTATPAGLSIDAATGAVNTGTSTPGTYTVRYSITPSGGCSPFSTTASISITRLPVATFSYTGTLYCRTAANPFPTFSGGGVAGTFSASPAGLVFVSTSTGQVNLAASAPGTYTVTNTITASGPCPIVTATSPITVTTQAAATISYPSAAYCADAGTINVTLSGTPGGTFSALPAGLSLNTATGSVNIGTSTAGAYTVTYNIPASGGCTAVNATTPLTVNALPLAFTGPDRSICSGATIQLGTAPIGGHTYSWTSNPAGFFSSDANPSVTPSATTTYTLTELITATGCTRTNSVTITANQIIAVTITPPVQSICSGGTTNIQLASNIAGTTFSWSPMLISGSLTTGFSSGTGPQIAQTIVNTSGAPSVVQYTIAANASGCSNTQNTIDITINPIPATPVITAGGPTSFCLGGSVVLTSTITTSYQWLLDGNPIPGATGRNHTANAGGNYTVTVSDVNGCSATSGPLTVTITPTPAISNLTTSVCSGATLTVSPVNGTDGTVPAGTTYSWPVPVVTGGITGGAVGSNAGSITVTLTNPTSSPYTATYTITPTAATCTGAPFTLVVTVNPAPAVTPMASAACSGSPFTVTPINGTNGLVPAGTTYSWPAPVVTGGITGGAPGTGAAIGGTLNNPANTAYTATYTVTPVYNSCPGAAFAVTITVNPTPSINNMTAVVCEGGTFNAAPANGTNGIVPAGTTYSWPAPVVTGGLTGGAAGINVPFIAGSLTNPTNLIQTATYTVTPTSGSCTGASFTVTVSVNPVPEVNNITSTICSGTAFSITPADGINGVVPPSTLYSWGVPTVTGGITGGSAGTNQASIGAILTNPTNTVQTATYTVTPAVGTCPGTNFTIVVTVNPTPAISNKTTSTCGGVPFTVTPVNGADIVPAGTTYSWPAPVLQAGLTGGAAGNNASNISGNIVNTTNNALTATYTVTPTYNGCSGVTFTVIVTVNPAPAISNKTANLCSGTVFTVAPVNGPDVVPAGTVYSWPAPGAQSGVGGLAAGTNQANISGTLTNSNSTPRTVVYTVTPSISGCTGSPFTVTVTINPSPPAYNISFYQFNNVDYFQRCDGQDVYTQNDMDILLPPSNNQPPANYFQGLGYTSWRYESSSSPTGPWAAASGTLTVFHQFILPVPPSPYSPIGDYYFRLAVYNNGYGCSSFSDVIHLNVTSTMTIEAGGPESYCQSSSPTAHQLTGASVSGTSSPLSPRGAWSITSLNPTNGGNNGTLSSTAQTTTPNTITYTPPANYTGTVTLTLTSNDPDGGGPCLPLTDTRIITITPAPTVITGPAINTCSSSSPAPLTLSGAGFGGGATTAAWSITNLSPANGGNNGTLSSTAQTADPSIVTYTPPAGYSGTVTLTLTTNTGSCTPASGTRNIVINPAPACSITGDNNVCPGTTNIYSGPAGMTSYAWSITAGTATIPGAANGQTVSVLAPANCSSYTLSLTIVNSNSCQSTCTQVFTSADAINPVISCPLAGETVVDANNGTTYVHSGTAWNATATDNCGAPVIGYTLTGVTTGTGTSLNGVSFNEGLTTVTWTATDLCGHSVTCSYNIRVNASSDLAVTKTASPSPANAGGLLTYTITLTNTGSAAAQNVVITDNIAFFTNAPQYALAPAGPWTNWTGTLIVPGTIPHNGTYTLYIRGNVPCAQLTNTVSVTSTNDNNPANNQATVVTQVQDSEYPDFSFCPPLQQVCTVSGNTYTNTGTGWDAIGTDDCGVASLTYVMTGATTGTGSNSLNGVTFNPGVTIVTWRVTDNSGRYAECDFNVTVNLNDECSITGPDNVCTGAVNTYTGPATVYPYNPYSYSWAVTAGSAVIQGSNTTQSIQVQAPPASGSFTLGLTVTNLCGSTTCYHTYNVIQAPVVTVNSPSVCEGNPATVTATPGTPGSYDYTWTVPGGVPNPGNVASFTTTVAGTYSVVITDQITHCASASASGTVTLSPLPVTSPIYHQ